MFQLSTMLGDRELRAPDTHPPAGRARAQACSSAGPGWPAKSLSSSCRGIRKRAPASQAPDFTTVANPSQYASPFQPRPAIRAARNRQKRHRRRLPPDRPENLLDARREALQEALVLALETFAVAENPRRVVELGLGGLRHALSDLVTALAEAFGERRHLMPVERRLGPPALEPAEQPTTRSGRIGRDPRLSLTRSSFAVQVHAKTPRGLRRMVTLQGRLRETESR